MKKIFYLTLICLVVPFIASAGGISSGGGTSIVCRNKKKKISNVRMLDLYEGAIRFEYPIVLSNVINSNSQYQSALANIKDSFLKTKINELANRLISKIKFLPNDVILAPASDLGDSYGIVIPDGCELSAVGFYEKDGTLRVSRKLYNFLSQTDKAAFILHEAIYKILRDTGVETNSENIRQIVAMIFSKDDFSQDATNLIKERSYIRKYLDGSIHKIDELFPVNYLIVPPNNSDIFISVTPQNSGDMNVKYAVAATCSKYAGYQLAIKECGSTAKVYAPLYDPEMGWSGYNDVPAYYGVQNLNYSFTSDTDILRFGFVNKHNPNSLFDILKFSVPAKLTISVGGSVIADTEFNGSGGAPDVHIARSMPYAIIPN